MPNPVFVMLVHNVPLTYLVGLGQEAPDLAGARGFDGPELAIEAAVAHQEVLARGDKSWWAGRYKFSLLEAPAPQESGGVQTVPLYGGLGYVRLVEAYGSDERIVESARMSTGKGFLGWGPAACDVCRGTGKVALWAEGIDKPAEGECRKCSGKGALVGDERLLSYLWRNHHHTPFEMAGLIVEYEVPIFVERQMVRHGTLRRNELSARYTELPEKFWLPAVDGVRRQAGWGNKQAGVHDTDWRTECAAQAVAEMRAAYAAAARSYGHLLGLGVAREQARAVVPVGVFTRVRVAGSLRNWLHCLGLRLDSHAQEETRELARAIESFVALAFPRTLALFRAYDVEKPVVAAAKEGL